MPKRTLEDTIVYEPDWSDKIEPYTSALALGADIAGLAASGSIVGLPAGLVIAGLGNIPNLAVDAYQFGRDLYRGNKKGSINNGIETALDITGIGSIKYLNTFEKGLKKDVLKYLEKIEASPLTEAQKAKNRAILLDNANNIRNKRHKIIYGIDGVNGLININHSKDMFVNPFDNPNITPHVIPNDNIRNVKRRSLKD